jgi:glycosyltransferase involved in cell wall biosynthesis
MLSVIIPTRNKADHLRWTLTGLARQQSATPFEVVIVVDASTDDTMTTVQTFAEKEASWSNFQVIELTENVGRASARNTGIQAALGDYAIFLDDDSIPASNLVHAHASVLADASTSSPVVTIGVIRALETSLKYEADLMRAPLAKSLERHGVKSAELFDALAGSLAERGLMECVTMAQAMSDNDDMLWKLSWQRGTTVDRWYRLLDRGAIRQQWTAFTGQHAGASLPVLREIGGFDEQFRGWGEEDMELGYRLQAAGCSFRVVDAPVFNRRHPRDETHQWSEWLDNHVYFVDKYERPKE